MGRMRTPTIVLTMCAALPAAGCATFHPDRSAFSIARWRQRVAAAEERNMVRPRPASLHQPPFNAARGTDGRVTARGSGEPASTVDWADADEKIIMLADFGPADLDWEQGAGETAESPRRRSTRGPLPGFWETVDRDLRRMPQSLWEDTKAVYTKPLNLAILGGAGAASLAVRCAGVDGKIADSHAHHDVFRDEWADAVGVLGNPGTHFAAAGLWYLVGQQTQDEKTYEVGRTLFNALIINGLTTMALKVAANTDSPNGEGPAWPSGHTSSSFTVAEVLNQSYGPWVGVPAYALAGVAAFGRIDDEEHDFSDLIFGMALGIVVGHTVAAEHEFEIFGGEITPYVDPYTGGGGLAWVKYW